MLLSSGCCFFFFFFFNDTATTEIYTLSLHDALPISLRSPCSAPISSQTSTSISCCTTQRDRKSTRLISSHSQISYAVFCLKKKKKKNNINSLGTKKNKTNQRYPIYTH